MIIEEVLLENVVQSPNSALWENAIAKGKYAREYWCGNIHFATIGALPNSKKQNIGLLGYAVDEGVRRNGGRVGAKFGPAVVRKRLSKLPVHFDGKKVFDIGDIHCQEGDLETAQENLTNAVASLLHKRVFPVVIGGGHDISFGHFKGIQKYVETISAKKIGILNFDAHFDLRSVDTVPNSGTPFYQIQKDLEAKGEEFHYCVLGIQQQSNMRTLFNRADELGLIYLKNDVCTLENFEFVKQQLDAFLNKIDCLYVTIDLDVFSSAYAPGVSAPSPFGLTPEFGVKVLEYLFASKKVISADIAELNPTYDADDRSAILVARLVDYMVTQYESIQLD